MRRSWRRSRALRCMFIVPSRRSYEYFHHGAPSAAEPQPRMKTALPLLTWWVVNNHTPREQRREVFYTPICENDYGNAEWLGSRAFSRHAPADFQLGGNDLVSRTQVDLAQGVQGVGPEPDKPASRLRQPAGRSARAAHPLREQQRQPQGRTGSGLCRLTLECGGPVLHLDCLGTLLQL